MRAHIIQNDKVHTDKNMSSKRKCTKLKRKKIKKQISGRRERLLQTTSNKFNINTFEKENKQAVKKFKFIEQLKK